MRRLKNNGWQDQKSSWQCLPFCRFTLEQQVCANLGTSLSRRFGDERPHFRYTYRFADGYQHRFSRMIEHLTETTCHALKVGPKVPAQRFSKLFREETERRVFFQDRFEQLQLPGEMSEQGHFRPIGARGDHTRSATLVAAFGKLIASRPDKSLTMSRLTLNENNVSDYLGLQIKREDRLPAPFR